jgi:PAS domain S-box-containing protein
MNRAPKSSIKRKVTTVIRRASICVLLVTVAAFMIYDLVTFRQTMVQNLMTQARTIANNTTGDLAFGNDSDAASVLAALQTEPHIVAAALYDAQGRLFTKYPDSIPDADLPAAPQGQGYQFGKFYLTLFEPVVQAGRPLGTLYLRSDLTALSQRLQVYGAISLLITAGSLVVAYWLSTLLQRRITNPIIALATTARNITDQGNFSVRAAKMSDDELGDLTEAFNTMLDQIQTSHADLEKSRAQLQIVTDYASVFLCHIDRRQIFQFVNPAYAARFNLTPQQVVGRTISEVVGEKAYNSFRHHTERALAGERVEFELEIPYEKLGARWVHSIYVPEKNDADEVVGFVGIINDITARKQAAEALRESERRERERAEELAVVIEAMPVPVIIVHDAAAQHMTGNRAADKLARIPSGTEISMSASEEVKPRHFKVFKDGRELRPDELPAQRAARGEPVQDFEVELVFDDGTVRNLLAYGTPLLDEQGNPRGAVHTLVDITERKRAEAVLREAKEAAERASRSKDDFLAALSHELRTPLNPVLLIASDAATDAKLPEKTRADFEMIRRNVELEARLIDDLLDLTRIVRGKLLLEKRPLDVRAVLQDAVAIVQPDAELKKIGLTLDWGTGPAIVLGDAVRLQQIFWNVLKNAVKFTPEHGQITVEVRLLGENGNIAIKIMDTGIGLSSNEINHIFEAFAQGDHAGRSGSHQFGGLGLGLAISRMLVELHAGVIYAASAGRDQGATFTIEFPALPTPATDGNGDNSAAKVGPITNNNFNCPVKNQTGQRVLLVEDHEPTRQALAFLLSRRGYKVVAALSVAEARTRAQLEPFDLVVSDIGLPDGDGYALMRELRDAHGLKGIALSGYGMEQDVAQGKSAGFVAYLVKPVRVELLEKALADFFKTTS